MSFDPALLAVDAHNGWTPPDTRPIYEWAADNIDLPAGGYAIPGRFDVQRSRHLIDVFHDLNDPEIRQVNLLKGIQSAGTLSAELWLVYVLANEPGPAMWNFHDEALAKRNAQTRLMPIIKGCPALAHLLPNDRHDLNKMGVVFRNGVPLDIQAGTIGRLQGRSIRYMVNDELWQWDDGMFREATARLDAYARFGMEKVVNVSQAGIEGGQWHQICFDKATSFSEWQVPCIHCGAFQVLRMELASKESSRLLMLWDENGGNIRYECQACGKPMEDSASLKAHFNEHGKYADAGPLAVKRTRRWNSLCWTPWAKIVEEYRYALDAKKQGSLEPLKSFIMKRLAEFWREDETIPIIKPEFYDIENTNSPEKSVRFMSVDVQTDHFWCLVREWQADGSSRLLHWSRALSWSELIETQKRFNVSSGEWQALRAWERGGRKGQRPATVSHVVIDTGGDRTQEVYDSCWKFGWIGLKGTDRESYVHRLTNQHGSR